MYYVATSWDKSGHSPTQEELNNGLDNFRTSPTTLAYNICNWQPHLENSTLVNEIWQWIEYYCNVGIDYSSMTLADKQVWWLIAPEPMVAEDDLKLISIEFILDRQIIINQISDTKYYHTLDKSIYDTMRRKIYPKLYMQVQSLMDYMHNQYSYFPVVLNKPTLWPLEFNYEFGKYFKNIPVLPICMATFFSKPKTVRHQRNNRQVLSTTNNALTMFKTTPVDNPQPGQKRLPLTYWWNEHTKGLGEELSYEENLILYAKRPKAQRPTVDISQINFNVTEDLF